MSKLLTIVIPAYNMHDYLRRCLDSICVESVMDKVQVLVVNDGSTDDTSQIAHEYEQLYPHYFQVIDKENGNYGSCMNVALPLAVGKYFRTLDADDWYDSDAYSRFVSDLFSTNADLIITEKVDHYQSSPNEKRPFLFPDGLPIGQDVSLDDIEWNNPSLKEMMGVMFLTAKTQLLRRVQMKWSEGVFYSDFENLLIPLFQAETVRLSPYQVYQYLLGRPGQSVNYEVSLKNMRSFAVVLRSVFDRMNRSQFCSRGAEKLFQLKMDLLVRVSYYLFFQKQFVLDTEIQNVERRICQVQHLKSLTDELVGFRNHRYVYAYRHCRFLYYLYCLDCRLRTNPFLRKLFRKQS